MMGWVIGVLFLSFLAALGFRAYWFLRHGVNPELTLWTLLGFNPTFDDWAGVQKISDWLVTAPIEFIILFLFFGAVWLFTKD